MKVRQIWNSGENVCLFLATILLLLAQIADAQQLGPAFDTFSAKIPAAGQGAVADWGDFDNDGDLDALVTGGAFYFYGSTTYVSSGAVRVYRNDGGTFTDLKLRLANLDGNAVWGDIDRDGRLDIIMAGTKERTSAQKYSTTTYYVGIFRQTSPNSFSPITRDAFGESRTGAFSKGRLPISRIEKVADVNGDGWPDIIESVQTKTSGNPPTTKAEIYVCTSAKGSFSSSGCVRWATPVGYSVPPTTRPIFVDLDRDGRLDIILGQNILLQKEPLKFTSTQAITGVDAMTAACADLNGDSFPDIAYTAPRSGGGPPHAAQIFINDKTGKFSLSSTTPSLPFPFLAFGDLDRDGDNDIVSFSSVSGADNTRLIENRGNNSWLERPAVVSNVAFKTANWVDLDGDYDLDIQYQSSSGAYNDSFVINPLASITGRIARQGIALTDVSLRVTSSSQVVTSTDTRGRYSFLFLPPGSYEVTPLKSGYTFSPPSRTVQYSGNTVTQVDFAAAVETQPPTATPTITPSITPKPKPTTIPTKAPTITPTPIPTKTPTKVAITTPASIPTRSPTPKVAPTPPPTPRPTKSPRYTPHPVCGNGVCEEDNVCSCPSDCSRFQWACGPHCGDGSCSATESCSCSDCKYMSRCMGGGYYGSPGYGGWTPPAGRPCLYPAPGVKICI